MSGKTKAIIWGGLAIGLISAVPLIGWGWFVWAFLGGGLASFLFVRMSPVPVQTGDGVVVGLLAGLLGGAVNIIAYSLLQVVYLIVSAAMTAFNAKNGQDFTTSFASTHLFSSVFSVFWIIFNLILIIPITLISLLGGLAGAAIFEKRSSAPPQYYVNRGGNYQR